MVTGQSTIVTESVGANGSKQQPHTVAIFATLSRSTRTCSGVRPRKSSRALDDVGTASFAFALQPVEALPLCSGERHVPELQCSATFRNHPLQIGAPNVHRSLRT
jgi:hypothetical protein